MKTQKKFVITGMFKRHKILGICLILAVLFAPATFYKIFVGLVLYLILALSDSFSSGFGVASTAFEYLLQSISSIGRGF